MNVSGEFKVQGFPRILPPGVPLEPYRDFLRIERGLASAKDRARENDNARRQGNRSSQVREIRR